MKMVYISPQTQVLRVSVCAMMATSSSIKITDDEVIESTDDILVKESSFHFEGMFESEPWDW